MIMKFTKNR